MHPLSGKDVLVLGGTGFIGGRLIEKLVLECGARVRTLTHNVSRAARIARFDVSLRVGDATELPAVTEAASGCDVIFDCAFPFSAPIVQWGRMATDTARAIRGATLTHGVRRVVHTGTFTVYGTPADGDLTEDVPPRPPLSTYARAKLQAQSLLLQSHDRDGLPAVVLQPTIVYGPFSGSWTLSPMRDLQRGRVVLPADGTGLCNAVFIDDVVDAMISAATVPDVEGQTFLISGAEPVTWGEFYGAYEAILGVRSLTFMSAPEIRARRRQQVPEMLGTLAMQAAKGAAAFVVDKRKDLLQLPLVTPAVDLVRSRLNASLWAKVKQRTLAAGTPTFAPRTASPDGGAGAPMHLVLPGDDHLAMFASRTRVRIDKATRSLGYVPRFGLDAGMRLVGEWAHWANLA